jgi:PAS domain S-box-containing protein
MTEFFKSNSDSNTIPLSLIQKLLSESNIQRLLETLTTYVEDKFPHVRASILTYDPDRNRLIPGSHPSLPISIGDYENSLPVDPNLTTGSRAAYYKGPILTSDIWLEDSWAQFRMTAKTQSIRAVFALPILSAKLDLLGVFNFYYPFVLSHFPEETAFFETLASIAAVTLERYSSERKAKVLLEKLESSQERLKLALQSQKMGVWDWYVQPDRLIWDDTILEIFGVKRTELRGNISDMDRRIHPEDLETTVATIRKAIEEKYPVFDHQFRILRSGEIRHISAVGYVVRDQKGEATRMTGLHWDITEKVIAHKKLEQERAKTIANSKMASLGEMASGIAHEINNPLTIILNRANQLKTRIQETDLNKEWAVGELVKIEGTVERIAKIIRGLRAFSRNADNDPMISCEFNSILDETLELCREKFKRFGITFSIRGFQNTLILRCRPSQISQVLLNLFNNSFDSIVNSQNPWVELEVTVEKSSVKLRVTDSGHGIPVHIADRMMDPFFSTKEVGRGTGLGLSISKGIIEEHCGRLWYDREHPFTSFMIELPLEENAKPVRSSQINIATSIPEQA